MNIPVGTILKHYENGDIYKIVGTRKIRNSYKYILQQINIDIKCSIKREFLLDAIERKVFFIESRKV